MPWTFAHPAAVLPFRRLCPAHLSFAGLVVGSLTPDLGYYVGRFDVAAKAHTPFGLVAICLPVGLAALALVRLLHRPVAFLLPQPHRLALLSLPHIRYSPVRRALPVAIVSLLLGAATHVAWDAFTHRTGYFVVRLHVLQAPLLHLASRAIHVYEVLQHASTVAGIVLLTVSYSDYVRAAMPHVREAGPDEWLRYMFLGACALISLACAGPLALADAASLGLSNNVSVVAVRVVVYATTVFAGLIVAAAAWVACRDAA